VIHKIEEMPRRKALGVAAIGVALIAFALATINRGLFDGITLTIGIAALALSLLQRLPTRPNLILAPRAGDRLIARHDQAVRPIDADAITAAEMAISEKEMPRKPIPRHPPGSPLAGLIPGEEASRNLVEITSGITDASLHKYMDKVSSYTIKLRKWLELIASASLRVNFVSARPGKQRQITFTCACDFPRVSTLTESCLRFHRYLSGRTLELAIH
jgi:hypothetical protein